MVFHLEGACDFYGFRSLLKENKRGSGSIGVLLFPHGWITLHFLVVNWYSGPGALKGYQRTR